MNVQSFIEPLKEKEITFNMRVFESLKKIISEQNIISGNEDNTVAISARIIEV